MAFIRNIFSKSLKHNSLVGWVRFQHNAGELGSTTHKVNNLERRFLVWTGNYKTVKEVPTYVSQSTMEKCRNRVRIKIANYMMLATVIGCFAMVYVGKKEAKEGVSLVKLNQQWHDDYKAQKEKEGQVSK
ncbi:unnamed protein product [Phyllotreta striolata]|uniref:Uncharacterized protein n=1 Tax=Phyllotreta striolata TaxID=444603 RepID=A0A9N9TSJ3_PHYSR|nr:unnamed protein product [Phyllotreta striolata]